MDPELIGAAVLALALLALPPRRTAPAGALPMTGPAGVHGRHPRSDRGA